MTAPEVIDGRFELFEKLGEGGMGSVYRAHQLGVDCFVALKLLKSGLMCSPEQQLRFRTEAKAISILDHPNIVSIYATGITADGSPYIAMELLDGVPVSSLIENEKPLYYQDVLRIFIQACLGLEHAHGKGVIHRDIKPSNLIVKEPLSEPTVKVVDFGIAKILGEDGITRTNVVLGSAFYLSPGQAQGRATDVSSDIYALGCSLFEAITGQPPFRGDSFLETASKHQFEEVPLLQEVNPKLEIPPGLQQIVDCCMQKESLKRYASVADLRADLQRVLDGEMPIYIPARRLSTRGKNSAADTLRKNAKQRSGTAGRVIAVVASMFCVVVIAFFASRGSTTSSEDSAEGETLEQAYADCNSGIALQKRGLQQDAYRMLKKAMTCPNLTDDPLFMLDLGVNTWITATDLTQDWTDENAREQMFTPALELLLRSVPLVEERVHSGTIDQGHARALSGLFHGHALLALHYRRRGPTNKVYQHEDKMFQSFESGLADEDSANFAINEYFRDALIYAANIKDRERALVIARRLFDLQKKHSWTKQGMMKLYSTATQLVNEKDPAVKKIWSEVYALLRQIP